MTSTLSLYRRAIELRRTHVPDPTAVLEWYGAPPGCLAFRPAGSALVCALNTSDVPVPLPPGDVLVASCARDGDVLAPDTAVWLA
jgi:alpha-glucosidase